MKPSAVFMLLAALCLQGGTVFSFQASPLTTQHVPLRRHPTSSRRLFNTGRFPLRTQQSNQPAINIVPKADRIMSNIELTNSSNSGREMHVLHSMFVFVAARRIAFLVLSVAIVNLFFTKVLKASICISMISRWYRIHSY
jgi:hypothetical protein